MRLLIAINLDDEMKEALMDIQDTMRIYGVPGSALRIRINVHRGKPVLSFADAGNIMFPFIMVCR